MKLSGLRSPVLRRLALFMVGAVLVVNAATWLLSQPRVTLHYTGAFVLARSGMDSWRPMIRALEYLDQPDAGRLYPEIFFNQRKKFQYPPASLLYIEPLRRIARDPAVLRACLNTVSWLSLAVTAVFCGRILAEVAAGGEGGARWGRDEKRMLWCIGAFAALTFYPLTRAYYLGQIQAWINCFIAIAVWAWMHQRRALAGVLCALSCTIKPQFGLLLVWAAVRRDWVFVRGFGITAAAAVAAGCWVYGVQNHIDYLEVVRYIARHGESFYPNQSVNGLLNRMLFNGSNLRWDATAFAPYNAVVHAGTIVSSVLLILFALVWRSARRGEESLLDFLMAILCSTMAAPVVWEHHYGVALPAFAVVAGLALRNPNTSRLDWVLLGAAYLLTGNLLSFTNGLADTRFNFLQSYVLLGGLVLLVSLSRFRRAVTADEPVLRTSTSPATVAECQLSEAR